MSYPTLTYTFLTGGSVDASRFNTNYQDVINGFSDASSSINNNDLSLQSLSVADTTVAGNLTQPELTVPSLSIGDASTGIALKVDGSMVVTGDVYATDWIDISATCGLSGWDDPPDTKMVKYRLIEGGLCEVAWNLDGTDSGAGTFFWLPYPRKTLGVDGSYLHEIEYYGSQYAEDDGVPVDAGGRYNFETGSNGTYLSLAMDWQGGSWSGVHKVCRGTAIYPYL